ncbi:hypothetical protein LWI28_012342 [Acer negundo]|uniref:Uncharacterized protein n=1 Tax=Acer negundo TaxID=4023 RepID=A0AAD5ILF6_ACENE|nr:hypothetical protein LWI28_012342 [Acer negundo]
MISKDESPVDLFWLSEFLGLKRMDTKGNLKSLSDNAKHKVDGFPSIMNQLDVILGEEVDRGLFVKVEKVMDKSWMCQLMNKKGNDREVKEGWRANLNEGKERKGLAKDIYATSSLVSNQEDKALSFFKTSKGRVKNQDKIRLGKDSERKKCYVFKGSLMKLWSEDKVRKGCGKRDKDKDKGQGFKIQKGVLKSLKARGVA